MHFIKRRLARSLATLLLFFLLLPWVAVYAQSDERCFVETGQCVGGRFLEFWEQNGGQAVFGLPISPRMGAVVNGRMHQVQWFEYHRLEHHPQNLFPDDVLLTNLGTLVMSQQERPPRDAPSNHFDCLYFETGHDVCGEVLMLWRAYGLEMDGRPGTSIIESRALFGVPLTGGYGMTFPAGHGYIVQWFERARFEVHPEGARLGRIGWEVYTGTPPEPAPAPVLLPGSTPSISSTTTLTPTTATP